MEAQVQALARLLGTLGALHDLLGDRLAQANPEVMARFDRLLREVRDVLASTARDAEPEELRAIRQAAGQAIRGASPDTSAAIQAARAVLDDPNLASSELEAGLLLFELRQLLDGLSPLSEDQRRSGTDVFGAWPASPSGLPAGFGEHFPSPAGVARSATSASSFEENDMVRIGADAEPVRSAAPPPRSAPASAAPSATAARGKAGADYVVAYATNRRPIDPADPAKGYSGERDDVVHHGCCRVFVPETHRIGSVGSGFFRRIADRLRGRQDDRLQLRAIEAMANSDFWRDVQRRLRRAPKGRRDAVVFVHGYNVSFQDAALRAAQIGFDLSISGAMAFFSWPSRGRLDGYIADSATIEASEGAIADFLVGFLERSGADTVHVIAHSMGNRGVLRAVNRIAGRLQQAEGAWFGQFLLAAADVDAGTFRMLASAYGQVARRTTLYVSGRDRAVEASRWLHNFDRVGLIPPVTIVPGIDTINVTNVDLTALGHGYVGEARDVLRDMHSLIAADAAPDQRFGVRAMQSQGGLTYWEIGA